MRDRAQTVIVGAGIVGASAAYHLAEMGVTDVLVLDQGPLFETGGSTSHAPGLVFQTNGSRTMCRIAQDSVALYDALDLEGERVWYGVGGPRARDDPRADGGAEAPPGVRAQLRHRGDRAALARRVRGALAAAGPADDPRRVLGAVRRRGQGVEDRRGARPACRGGGRRLRGRRRRDRVRHPRRAASTGSARTAATWPANASCCAPGSGDPSVGDLAGVPIPLVAVQHQLVWTDPVPGLEGLGLGDAPGRAAPGHVAVLPPARGPLRGRELPARADPHAAGATSARRAARCSPR